MIQLRPDQLQLKANVFTDWQRGMKNVCAVLATGGGKSVIMSDIANDYRHCEQAIIAHRKELIGQMSVHIARRGIKHKIIAPDNVIKNIRELHREEFNGRHFIDSSAHASVCSIDTIISPSRSKAMQEWAERVLLWQMDEGHHVVRDNKWGKGLSYFKNAYGIGWTASPARPDGLGLGAHADGLYHSMCQGIGMRELIQIGALCRYEVVIPNSDFNRDNLTLDSHQEFTQASLINETERSGLTGDIVSEYLKHARGKQAICFVSDVKTAHEVAENFKLAGVAAAAVSANSEEGFRYSVMKRFKRREIQVLVNVDLFGEGLDVPGIEVVIMARATNSLIVYLQQFGRVLRVLEGKLFGLVIDHVSNFRVHKHPDRPRVWTLDRRDKRAKSESDPDDVPITVCKACNKPYEQIYRCCPYCGAVPIVKPRERIIDQIDGDLTRLDFDTLQRMFNDTMINPGAAAERGFYAGGAGAAAGQLKHAQAALVAQDALREAIAVWAAFERSRGRPDSESYMRFYHATGMDVLSAQALPRREMETLTKDIQRWIIGQLA